MCQTNYYSSTLSTHYTIYISRVPEQLVGPMHLNTVRTCDGTYRTVCKLQLDSLIHSVDTAHRLRNPASHWVQRARIRSSAKLKTLCTLTTSILLHERGSKRLAHFTKVATAWLPSVRVSMVITAAFTCLGERREE